MSSDAQGTTPVALSIAIMNSSNLRSELARRYSVMSVFLFGGGGRPRVLLGITEHLRGSAEQALVTYEWCQTFNVRPNT